MKKTLLDLEMEIKNGQEKARRAEELYQLLTTYNAYCALLLKAMQEYERTRVNIKQDYLEPECYESQANDLFSIFKSDECLSGTIMSEQERKDTIFLIDQDNLLRITSYDIASPTTIGLSDISYDLLKISSCMAKVYKQSIYHRDPYYCYSYFEEKDSFGLFHNDSLITPSFELKNQFKPYDNMDIREILRIQTLEEIHDKLNESKNEKVKKLTLTR